MKRVMAGIALAAIGLAASATFATAANAADGSAYFTNWGECQYVGNSGWINGHKIISFSCYDNGYHPYGGPNAYMLYTY